jgi:hypothetical protein
VDFNPDLLESIPTRAKQVRGWEIEAVGGSSKYIKSLMNLVF